MSRVLTIEHLSKTYPGGVRALRDVSLRIPTGMFGLLGPNGAGKSTLMRTIATLQEPDSGRIMLDDLDVLREKDQVRRLLLIEVVVEAPGREHGAADEVHDHQQEPRVLAVGHDLEEHRQYGGQQIRDVRQRTVRALLGHERVRPLRDAAHLVLCLLGVGRRHPGRWGSTRSGSGAWPRAFAIACGWPASDSHRRSPARWPGSRWVSWQRAATSSTTPNVVNEYLPSDVQEGRQAEYEREYKQYEELPLPRITALYADVDIYPERRVVDIRGRYTLRNRTASPVPTLHITVNPLVTVRAIEAPGLELTLDDETLGYRIYELSDPLAPGAAMELAFDVAIENPGFVTSGSNINVVENGTFINNLQYFPRIGYSRGGELGDPNERRKLGLVPIQRMPSIDDVAARRRHYITGESDWIDFETVVSTSADQIALAPGYLQREWEEAGRRYFHYKMDAPILGMVAYLSADWEVARDRWNDVAIEIYYDEAHPYNVDRMIDGVKKSLDYLSSQFSPYQHSQVRIVEFPRYARFAQSLPNTIPFSESIGFIAKLDDEDEDAIDYVFYVTAHEVAHQWWAHQVIGGNLQGSTVLSETMSQYSALMIMEREYGREQMRRFLKYELDNYLGSRGGELIEELPLLLVENQGYIHYRKGSLVMYALRDYVGEEALNAALARYVAAVGFQEPPYTYAREFLSFVREVVPPEYESVIEDLFETITLYDNRTGGGDLRATARRDLSRQAGGGSAEVPRRRARRRARGAGRRLDRPCGIRRARTGILTRRQAARTGEAAHRCRRGRFRARRRRGAAASGYRSVHEADRSQPGQQSRQCDRRRVAAHRIPFHARRYVAHAF